MVSLSTSVPAMKATPSVMARALASRRNLWASNPRTVARNMAQGTSGTVLIPGIVPQSRSVSGVDCRDAG